MLFDSTIQKEQLIFWFDSEQTGRTCFACVAHIFTWKRNEVRTSGKYSKFDFWNVFMKKNVSFRILACNFWKGRFLPQLLMETKKTIGTNHFGIFGVTAELPGNALKWLIITHFQMGTIIPNIQQLVFRVMVVRLGSYSPDKNRKFDHAPFQTIIKMVFMLVLRGVSLWTKMGNNRMVNRKVLRSRSFFKLAKLCNFRNKIKNTLRVITSH